MEKYLSLLVGILAMFMAGSIYSFNVYAVALKSTFNLTQTEVEYIASTGDMGQSFHLPAGLIFDKFGPRLACRFGLIISGAGFGLLWLTTKFPTFFGANAWLICITYLVAMWGTTFTFIVSVGVNSKNFGRKHQGKVLLALDNAFAIAPTIYSVIYLGFFVQGHIKDAENQKYGDLMLFLTVMSVIINLLAIALLKVVPGTAYQDENEMNELFKTLEQENVHDETSPIANTCPKDGTKIYKQPDLNAWQTIKTLEFYYIFLVILIVGGVGATFVNNISIVLKSVHLENDIALFTTSLPIFSLLAKIVTVVVFNHIFLKYPDIPKSLSLLPITVLTLISQIIISFNQEFAGLLISTFMLSAAYGGFYLQLKWVCIELFGLKYFGQNYGIIIIAHSTGMFGFQLLFGFGYEVNSPLGSRECYGEFCSKRSFVLYMILCSVALFSNICLIKVERDTKERQHENIAL